MRGVGDEAAEPGLGRLAGPEGGFDLPEHRVQRQPEAADLGARLGAVDAAREVAGSDRGRGLLDLAERTKADAHDPERKQDQRREHRERHEQLDQEEPVQRRVDVVQGARDDQ